ncbi:MAG: hypothetical protein HY782_24780 [Chloroflexi bacterium]|nr:hypothetical protein [Chloroflexota bacterium]
MTEHRYAQLVRLMAVAVAILLWIMSIQFSAGGFNFVMPRYIWMGYALGIAVTVLQLVFAEEGMKHTLTLVVVGLLAYGYGIFTNIVGIWIAQGSPDLASNPMTLLFPTALGFILEVTPEPLLLWGLVGTGIRDALGQLFSNQSNSREAY